MWRWTATILASLAVASLQFQYGPTRKMFREKALSMLTQGNTEFASNVYQNLENGNAIFSPLSLLTALGLALSAANGTTAQEITTTLNIDPAFIGIGFRGLMKKIKGEVIHMKFANALFVQSDFPVMEEFSTRASKVFMAKVNNVDFSHNCTGAAKIINNWVKRKTRKKIKVIIPTGALSSKTKLVLVNAVYFKALWKKQFLPSVTTMEIFYTINKKTIQVPMMHNKAFYRYGRMSDLGARMLEMPYEDGSVSMIILLPETKDGIYELEQKVISKNLSSITKIHPYREVSVSIPRFQIRKSYDMKKVFKKLGITDMFNEETADFSSVTGKDENLYMEHFLHKGFIQVNEFGTEVGASTALVIEKASIRSHHFVADHPFIFLIWEKSLNTVIFMGRCMRP